MSESKFTPGPWFVEQSEKTPIYVSPVGRQENISICNVLVMDEDYSESGAWINGDQTKANAKLISAAPELLAALERCELLLRSKRHACEDNNLCHLLDSHISQAREAINKATE